MQVAVVDGANTNISGGILGTVSNTDLLKKINQKVRNYTPNLTFSGMEKILQTGRDFFIKHIVQPQQKLQERVLATLDSFNPNTNKIRPLVTMDDFETIPQAMIMPILSYKPVRDLYIDDRIFGFEIDKKLIPDRDVYRRLINNGKCTDVIRKVEQGKPIKCISIWKCTDPDISLEEIEMIEHTRMYIDNIIKQGIDPTSVSELIG